MTMKMRSGMNESAEVSASLELRKYANMTLQQFRMQIILSRGAR